MRVRFVARLVDGQKFIADMTDFTNYQDAERLIKKYLLDNKMPPMRVLFIGLPNMKV